jgi:hypothetical protein
MKREIVLKNPVARKAWAAMQAAVAKVVEDHRQRGMPLAIWQDGRVVYVHPKRTSVIRETTGKYLTRRTRR